eukprot:gene33943-41865_t
MTPDSGTGAMSRDQWAAIQHGRAAEKIIFTIVGGPGKCIANNTHFDTTRANIEFSGARAFDFVIHEGLDPANPHPFKGNMDLIALEAFITEYKPENIPMIMTTITNNSGGGQPGSLSVPYRILYGGLAGRDLEALAQGLSECVSHDYLNYRIHQTAYLGNALLAA